MGTKREHNGCSKKVKRLSKSDRQAAAGRIPIVVSPMCGGAQTFEQSIIERVFCHLKTETIENLNINGIGRQSPNPRIQAPIARWLKDQFTPVTHTVSFTRIGMKRAFHGMAAGALLLELQIAWLGQKDGEPSLSATDFMLARSN
jgi:hypothetical protein